MTIKERVLNAMKTSYAKYGFKSKELESMSEIISKNLTDESSDDDIANALTNNEGYAAMMQSIYNRGIAETNKRYEGWTRPSTTPQNPQPPVIGGMTVEEVQRMINEAQANRQKEIEEAVKKATEPFIAEQERARLGNLLANHEKLKDIPKSYIANFRLDKEENLDAVAASIESNYTTLKQEMVSSGQFVEAPVQATQQQQTDEFIKAMEGFSQRNAPKE